jgi:uncharacterized protein YjdB
MATLNALKKAPILDQDGQGMLDTNFGVSSSDPLVARAQSYGGVLYVTGVAAGTVVITATRNADGAVATLDVTVVAATPFAISLGEEVPA